MLNMKMNIAHFFNAQCKHDNIFFFSVFCFLLHMFEYFYFVNDLILNHLNEFSVIQHFLSCNFLTYDINKSS